MTLSATNIVIIVFCAIVLAVGVGFVVLHCKSNKEEIEGMMKGANNDGSFVNPITEAKRRTYW